MKTIMNQQDYLRMYKNCLDAKNKIIDATSSLMFLTINNKKLTSDSNDCTSARHADVSPKSPEGDFAQS